MSKIEASLVTYIYHIVEKPERNLSKAEAYQVKKE